MSEAPFGTGGAARPKNDYVFKRLFASAPQLLGDELQVCVVELRKADRAMRSGHGIRRALAAWEALLEHWKEARTMSDVQFAPVRDRQQETVGRWAFAGVA